MNNHGFIKMVILIVIALLILSYFGFNLRDTVESPTTQSNFSYAKMIVVNIWNDYLKRPAKYLWNEVFIKLIWNTAVENLLRLKTPQQSTINDQAPLVAPAN
jgi:flagellar assembly factor FliW